MTKIFCPRVQLTSSFSLPLLFLGSSLDPMAASIATTLLAAAVILACTTPLASSFAPPSSGICNGARISRAGYRTPGFRVGAPPTPTSLSSAAPSDTDQSSDIPAAVGSAADRVEDCKRELIQQCNSHNLGGYSAGIEAKIKELEQLGEDAGFGQASALSGLMSGEW